MECSRVIQDLQTIKAYFEEQSEGCYPACLEEAIKIVEKYSEAYIRPQGKWIVIKSPLSNETVVKCPICKEEFIGNDVEDYNFCPICGAEMRGNKE